MITLSRRFSAAFILIVALPSLVVSVILARLYLSALYKTVELQSQATAEQVAQTANCAAWPTATRRPRARPSAFCGRAPWTRSW